MTVNPILSASLKAIGDVMAEAHDPWWIIASAAVALHRADPGNVSDVDVLLSVADARHILPTIGIELQPGSAHDAFRSSIFGTWTGTALPVEFMADFRRRSGEEWLPVQRPDFPSRSKAWLFSFPNGRSYRPCWPHLADRRTSSVPEA